MSFFFQPNRPVCPDLAIKRHAPTHGRRPGAAPDRRAWKQSLCERRAINARGRVAMQSATYAEIHADTPTLCLDAAASAKPPLVRTPQKAFPPRNAGALERGSSGAVFKRSFAVSCLYEIRCYKSIENTLDESPRTRPCTH